MFVLMTLVCAHGFLQWSSAQAAQRHLRSPLPEFLGALSCLQGDPYPTLPSSQLQHIQALPEPSVLASPATALPRTAVR